MQYYTDIENLEQKSLIGINDTVFTPYADNSEVVLNETGDKKLNRDMK